MKILLVIDHFGPGGAQRQIVELACGLRRRGHDVEVFVYFPSYQFFRSRLEAQHIVIHEHPKGGRWGLGVALKLASLVRDREFGIVVSYLRGANVYAELAKLIAGRFTLVVSERTSYHDDKSRFAALATRALHSVADRVVANSMTQADWLRRKWWLRQKVSCIYNGVDVDRFRPRAASVRPPQALRELQLIGVGRVGPEKNILNLIRALELLHEEVGEVPAMSWAGPHDDSVAGRAYRRQIDQLLAAAPAVRRRWQWLGRQPDVAALLHRHHALVHPSSYEGLPNVVCEALAAGLPVLVSDVCDHPVLVADGERGFLFDPNEPESIARAVAKLAGIDTTRWADLSRNARTYAVASLGTDRMVAEYESLFDSLTGQAHS